MVFAVHWFPYFANSVQGSSRRFYRRWRFVLKGRRFGFELPAEPEYEIVCLMQKYEIFAFMNDATYIPAYVYCDQPLINHIFKPRWRLSTLMARRSSTELTCGILTPNNCKAGLYLVHAFSSHTSVYFSSSGTSGTYRASGTKPYSWFRC